MEVTLKYSIWLMTFSKMKSECIYWCINESQEIRKIFKYRLFLYTLQQLKTDLFNTTAYDAFFIQRIISGEEGNKKMGIFHGYRRTILIYICSYANNSPLVLFFLFFVFFSPRQKMKLYGWQALYKKSSYLFKRSWKYLWHNYSINKKHGYCVSVSLLFFC